MPIPDDTVEEVRAASDIVDVVGDYVRLKKRGSNFTGLCPFHTEKTPSFNVNPGMGIFKCFGCGVGGDVFQFIMRTENVGFLESVRLLAAKTGIHIPEEGVPSENVEASEPVYNALRFAARFYYTQLTQAEAGKRGLEYLRKRGFTVASIKRFGVGYAPDAWDALIQEAEQSHITSEVLQRAGLVIKRREGEGHYDRYRDRIIFPIFSQVGKVLGFGGRVLSGDSDQPKYINSPETEVYSKSKVLYGLHHGKQSVRRAEEALLVEGYTDVIGLHQTGIENVVAVCGTSLTSGHVKMLTRYAKRIIFINDADAAGENATVRGLRLALEGGLTPYIVELPRGEDPDSFAQKNGREEVEAYLKENRWTFVQFLITRVQREGRMDNPEHEADALNEVLAQIAIIDDPIARDAYVREMSRLLGKPDILLYGALEKIMTGKTRHQTQRERYRYNKPAELSEEPQGTQEENRPDRDDTGWSADAIEPLPEEKLLVRAMLENGLPLIEFVLGNMGLEEFTKGPARDAMSTFIAQYQEGRVDSQAFLNGTYGDALQHFAAEVLMDRYEPSENWRKRNIPVPRLNNDPFEAAAGAMMLLKLDRLNDATRRVQEQLFQAQEDSEGFRKLRKELMDLQALRKYIEQKEFIQRNKAT